MNTIGSSTIQPMTSGVVGANNVSGGGDVKGSFKDFLMDSIKEVNGMQKDADHAVESLMTGGEVNPAEVLTAVQKADMAFRMMMQIRNKVVAAYDELRNIRI